MQFCENLPSRIWSGTRPVWVELPTDDLLNYSFHAALITRDGTTCACGHHYSCFTVNNSTFFYCLWSVILVVRVVCVLFCLLFIKLRSIHSEKLLHEKSSVYAYGKSTMDRMSGVRLECSRCNWHKSSLNEALRLDCKFTFTGLHRRAEFIALRL